MVRSPGGTPAFGEVVDPSAINYFNGDLGMATVAGAVVQVELVPDRHEVPGEAHAAARVAVAHKAEAPRPRGV